LIRRVPKRGFNNAVFKKAWAIVNLGDLEAFDAGTRIDEALLREQGFIRGKIHGVKVLAGGELTKPLKITANHASASAREKIEKAGGTLTLK
jgi:large subunit ribosomal protein L15